MANSKPGMDLFRSEAMNLVQLIIPSESAHHALTYLGELGLIQFKDLNPDKSPFQRSYAKQVKRCGEMLRRLRYLKQEITKSGKLTSSPGLLGNEIDFDDLEGKLSELEVELSEINSNSGKLLRSYNEFQEFHIVLQKAGNFFNEAHISASAQQRELAESSSYAAESSLDAPLLLEEDVRTESLKQGKLGFITGLVAKSKAASFERILFRATRGNLYFKKAEISEPVSDPASGEKMEKIVFLVFFSGERARLKITKICEAFGANRYPFPEDAIRQAQMAEEVSARLSELKTTIDASVKIKESLLSTISPEIESWITLVSREKAVYHTLNMLSFDVTRKCLVAEGWCPVSAEAQIQEALNRAAVDSNSSVVTIFQVIKTKELPPTYFKTNKFTGAFQDIVDAYGIARYQEINPAVFTIVTFPFLFAIMFGDWGHGICLLLGVLWLIWNEKKFGSQKLGDIMSMAFSGRYVILLMALFSIYTGLIYNEFFSQPFAMFGSSAYACSDSTCSDAYSSGLVMTRSMPYIFGVDPVWRGTSTELTFLNSLKMKMSILVGVAQMNLGIILSFFNAQYFKNDLNIWYQFIPQIIFLNGLFGYLSVLIILKWCTGSTADLYHVMIYMFLSPVGDLGENQLFSGQKYVQITLLILALIAIPWMLLPKPLIMRSRHLKKIQGTSYARLASTESDIVDQDHESDDDEHEEFEFGEIFVHQMIHAIEFVLGAVSNTASYLRLWALSLAHSELSSVFYEKVLVLAWGYSNILIIIVGFIIFVFATVGVLLCMETLSAFLHALRLHWVEFQNKFYEGDGYKFQPYSFADIEEEE